VFVSVTLQEVFRRGFERYAHQRRVPLHIRRAARAIRLCRTAALGGHVTGCPEGHEARVHYNSCRHRACPQCARIRIDRWLAAREVQLLPCDHYHVVFTIPHELEPLWYDNRRRMTELLFRCVRDTLVELLGDPRYLGARPGVLATLHTWGRTLTFHPHVHCLVTGGGLGTTGWRGVRNGYLLPVRVVCALFRGKLVAALRVAAARGQLTLPTEMSPTRLGNLLRTLGRRPWNVRIQERYAHGRGVLVYLGRYLRGGPISNRRLVTVDGARVVFRYRDHRDGRPKSMALPLEHFVQRITWHVPEPGHQMVRYFGLYARGKTAEREACRAELAALPAESLALASPRAVCRLLPTRERASDPTCTVCGRPLVVLTRWRRGEREPPCAAPS